MAILLIALNGNSADIYVSPTGSDPSNTSAQQLALIQQRYVAEQDVAQQQRRLRGQ